MDVSNDVERTRRFYEENDFRIPAAFDDGQRVAAATWGVIATPTNYLVDTDGRIVWRHYGFRRGDEVELRYQIERVLAGADALPID